MSAPKEEYNLSTIVKSVVSALVLFYLVWLHEVVIVKSWGNEVLGFGQIAPLKGGALFALVRIWERCVGRSS